jgi:hypothetical protein
MIYLSSFGSEMVEFEGVVAGQVFWVSDVETIGVAGRTAIDGAEPIVKSAS